MARLYRGSVEALSSPPRASPRGEASDGNVPDDRLIEGLDGRVSPAALPVSVAVTRSTATGNNGRKGISRG